LPRLEREALIKSDFDPAKQTFWIAEGLLCISQQTSFVFVKNLEHPECSDSELHLRSWKNRAMAHFASTRNQTC